MIRYIAIALALVIGSVSTAQEILCGWNNCPLLYYAEKPCDYITKHLKIRLFVF